MRRKIEIVDDSIRKVYVIHSYQYRRLSRWFKKTAWKLEWSQYLGYNYVCPAIYKGIETIKDHFDREVRHALDQNGIEEIHRIVIEKPLKQTL